jgi:hypothetical protein
MTPAPNNVEDAMKLFPILTLAGGFMAASPAIAHHPEHTNIPFPTRGACEAETQELSNSDDWLLDAFPDIFSSAGEVRSFLNRAFTCERNASDGQFYITDHRLEVLDSEWLKRRQ